MKIIDSYGEIFSVYIDGKFDMDSWEKYADKISPEFKEKIISDADNRLDFKRESLPVLNDMYKNLNLADTAHKSFITVTDGLQKKIIKTFGTDLDVTIVFYLGLCNGAGWAAELDGKPAVLLGVEKIVELNWFNEEDMINLIYHELGHIWHFKYEKSKLLALTKKEKAVRQLYREGMAMAFEQIMYGNQNFFHQDKNGWLDWCRNNETDIKREFLKRINCGQSVQDFFGDWCFYKEHSDVGYYLASQFIKYLLKDYTLREIAGLKIQKVCKKFKEYAEN